MAHREMLWGILIASVQAPCSKRVRLEGGPGVLTTPFNKSAGRCRSARLRPPEGPPSLRGGGRGRQRPHAHKLLHIVGEEVLENGWRVLQEQRARDAGNQLGQRKLDARQRRGRQAQRGQGRVVVGVDARQVGRRARLLLQELKAGALQGQEGRSSSLQRSLAREQAKPAACRRASTLPDMLPRPCMHVGFGRRHTTGRRRSKVPRDAESSIGHQLSSLVSRSPWHGPLPAQINQELRTR
jgi:hypothetical protein